MDFSGYKIQIPKEKTSGSLYEGNEDLSIFPKETIYPFDEGIKIILKEKRGLYLCDTLEYNKSVIKYFKDLGVAGFDIT